VIGLPVGAYLCFKLNFGATGMWAGLCLALVLIGSVLLLVWRRMVRQLPNLVLQVLKPVWSSPTNRRGGSEDPPLG
jgi:hypothetical protein